MAQEILSIPAKSVPAEQMFSRVGHIISKNRNRMLETSTSALLLIKGWTGQNDFAELELLEHHSEDDATGLSQEQNSSSYSSAQSEIENQF
jgi:hypothetical protein